MPEPKPVPMFDSGPERPWLSAYPPGVPADIDPPTEPVTGYLADAAARFPDHPALDFFGVTTTYRDLAGQVARAAEALRRLGVAPGDRVALVLPNCPQHVVAFYAVLRLRAVVVEHNPLYTADELRTQLADHGAQVVVCWDKVAATVLGLRDQTQVRTVIGVDLTAALPARTRLALWLPLPAARRARAEVHARLPQGVLGWEALVADSPPLPDEHPGPDVEDLAALQYTGGTTGVPKGAMLSHANLRANAEQGRAWVPELREGEETVYGILPLFHAYGLTLCLTFAVKIGACLVLLPRFDVDQVLAAVRRRPPTFLPGVPPIYDRLAAAAAARGVDLTAVRFSLSGAMPLPAEVVARWEQLTGGLLVEGYGMTEGSPILLGNPMSKHRRPGSVGVPFPSTSIRVVDQRDPDIDVGQGDVGELVVRGPQVFAGYWNRPEETAQTLLEGGWMRTGDLVTIDDDGFVRIVDRVKELIITGGFNVYPSEVETVVRDLPAVADCAVVGLPSSSGEQVAVAVVLEPGASLTLDELRAHCKQHLAAYKVPRRMAVVDDLPRNQIGKVQRRALRAQVETLPE